MIAVFSEDILVLSRCSKRWLTANGSDPFLLPVMIMLVSVSTIAVVVIRFAAEGVARVTRLRVVIQRVVTFVNADLSLGLKALPAIKDPVVRGIVVIRIVVKVARRHVVLHGNKRTKRVDHRVGLLLA